MSDIRKNKKNIWFHIPETWILVWQGSRHEKGLIALLVFIALLTGSYFWGLYSDKKERQQEYASIPNPFADVLLEAEVAYVFDVGKGKLLYGLHEERPVPIASITKIMTALVALDVLEKDTVIIIPKIALEEKGDNGLYWNEEWFLPDLITFMLISSSNDAAKAIALVAEEKLRNKDTNIQMDTNDTNNTNLFIERMNEKAAEIGLIKTEFKNVTGLDINSEEAGLPAEALAKAGAYGSAKDTVLLLAHAMWQYPDIFGATAQETAEFTSLSGFTHVVDNTNVLVSDIPAIESSKTGLTRLAGGNLVVALQNGSDDPLIISVLGSSESGRFSDMEKLISAAAALLHTD